MQQQPRDVTIKLKSSGERVPGIDPQAGNNVEMSTGNTIDQLLDYICKNFGSGQLVKDKITVVVNGRPYNNTEGEKTLSDIGVTKNTEIFVVVRQNKVMPPGETDDSSQKAIKSFRDAIDELEKYFKKLNTPP